jgi:upstream activation factor subunit UAF30
MAEVTDDSLRSYLRQTLKTTDLSTTTERKLRGQLEEHFGCDLKPRKNIFKEEIEQFLSQCQELEQGEPDDDDAAEEPAPAKNGKRKAGHTQQSLSEELRTFLGVDESEDISRGEVVKRIWAYIK